MSLAPQLKNFLVCPLCKGDVEIREGDQEIWCRADGLAFPIRDDIPVMLEEEARHIDLDEAKAV